MFFGRQLARQAICARHPERRQGCLCPCYRPAPGSAIFGRILARPAMSAGFFVKDCGK